MVFMGSDPIALPLLEWLTNDAQDRVALISVYTQPDRPAGRGQKVVANAIKQWAAHRGIPVYQPSKLDRGVREDLAAQSPDVALVMAYGHILGEKFMAVPRLGTLNLHASILPSYRGASPIQSAVMQGDTESGVSLMRIVRELDAGPVADIERVPVAAGDTAADLEVRLSQACVPLVARNLDPLRKGDLEFVEQDHAAASFCHRLTKADGVLDFSRSAAVLAARINGLHPWPGVRVKVGDHSIRLGGALADSKTEVGAAVPGEVVQADSEGLAVASGEGILRLTKLQRPGGRMLPAADFLRGFVIDRGMVLPSELMPDLITPA